MIIKPIETVYKGYKFRSRLEARWAVFLDETGVPYCYEHEGFDLDGTWYLPDFWLPESNHFIEIKPSPESFSTNERIRYWGLCFNLCKKLKRTVFLITGNPFPNEFTLHRFRPFSDLIQDEDEDGTLFQQHKDEVMSESGLVFAQCTSCGRMAITPNEQGFWEHSWLNKERQDCHGCAKREPWPDSDKIDKAFLSARQMRF